MKSKLSFAILTSFFFAFLLTGCQSKDEMLMDDTSDIKEISISKSTEFGKLNDQFFTTFEDSKELDILKKALITAKREKVKLEGINYDLLMTDYNGDDSLILQFYLGEEGEKSAFFSIGYEERVYFTSEETTQELRKIIKP